MASPPHRVWAWCRETGAHWVLGLWAGSRLIVALAGVGFDVSWLPRAYQFVDPELLRDDPFGTAWQGHTQPPLMNLFVGLVLRLAGGHEEFVFHLLYLALGATLALSVLEGARLMGARRTAAMVVAVVVACGPAAILYENWLFYSYPVSVGVTFVAVALGRWVRSGHAGWFVALCLVAGGVALTRSLFHPVWYLAVVGLALVARRPSYRRALAWSSAAIPLVMLGAIVVRNGVVFGVPGTSTWVGMNIQRVTTEQLDPADREALVADGTLSAQATVGAFRSYPEYRGVAPACEVVHDQAVWRDPVKATGYDNFNYECFVPLYRQAQADGLAAVRSHPTAFLRAQVASWQISMTPSEDFGALAANRDRIEPFDRLYRALVLVAVPTPSFVSLPSDVGGLYVGDHPISLTLAAATGVALVAGAWGVHRWRRCGPSAARVMGVYVGGTTLLVLGAGNLLEIGENNRFRWDVEPLLFLVLAVAVDRVLRRRSRRAAAIDAPLPGIR